MVTELMKLVPGDMSTDPGVRVNRRRPSCDTKSYQLPAVWPRILKKQILLLTSSRFLIGQLPRKAAQGIDPGIFVTRDDQGHRNFYRRLLGEDDKVNLANVEFGLLAVPVNGTPWHRNLPKNQLNLNPHHLHEQIAGRLCTFKGSSSLPFSPTRKNGR